VGDGQHQRPSGAVALFGQLANESDHSAVTSRSQLGHSAEAKEWAAQFKRVSRARKLRFVSNIAYRVGGIYLAVLRASRHPSGERGETELRWRWAIKPLVLDDILWDAFMPGTDMGGARARLNLKVTGAFTVAALPCGEGVVSNPKVWRDRHPSAQSSGISRLLPAPRKW
jgi:hypothetical protein